MNMNVDPASVKPQIIFTVIQAKRPKRLSKTMTLDADGALKKGPGGNVAEGLGHKVSVSSAAEFADMLLTLGDHTAAMYGEFADPKVFVMTQGAVSRSREKVRDGLPIVARGNATTSWPQGPGVLLGDYDPPDDGAAMTADELAEAIFGAAPGLRDAPNVRRPSASSCIYRAQDGAELRGVAGLRMYFIVADATDMERAGRALFDRLWLAGHGRIEISKSGAMLERTLIDGTVFQPSRLDFAGGAHCGPGVEQRLPAPEVFNADALPVDTFKAIPPLTKVERERLAEIKAEARAAKAPVAEAARAAWVAERLGKKGDELAGDEDADEKLAAYESTLRAAIDPHNPMLFADFELIADDGSTVTVGEVLDNPAKWDRREFCDPIEGKDYKDGRLVAWVNLRHGGRPMMISHAHGGARYRLVRARRSVMLLQGEIARNFEDALAVMREVGVVFDREGLLVRIVDGVIVPVEQEWLGLHLDRICRFLRPGRVTQNDPDPPPVNADCPGVIPSRIVKARGEWRLPRLVAVSDAPVFDPRTGAVVIEDGYDAGTALYLQLSGTMRPIPSKVTPADVKAAIDRLWHPFKDFPFADNLGDGDGSLSRGVFLSCLLTAVCRRLLPTAPAYLMDATAAGSGKTLLSRCVALMMTARAPTVSGVDDSANEVEFKKMLFAKALAGAPIMIIDNISGAFKSSALCSFTTTETYDDRILGASKSASVPTNALIMLNGNRPSIVGDLNRRVMRALLDTGMETPYRRAFKLDPLDYIGAHRMDMIRDALIVLKGWHDAGRPVGAPDRTASFEMWSDTVRQATIWVGVNGWLAVKDPTLSIDVGIELDPETNKLGMLLDAWHAVFGDTPTTLKAVAERLVAPTEKWVSRDYGRSEKEMVGGELFDEDLHEAIINEIGAANPKGELNARRLGRWIEGRAGRVVNGKRFVRMGKDRFNNVQWKVEKITQKASA
jgi:hypothetical protein